MFKFLGTKIRELFKKKVSEATLEELEALFYHADLGVATTSELSALVRKLYDRNASSEEILAGIKEELVRQLLAIPRPPLTQGTPHVILVVGVNGNGKTTTIAKLARHYQKEGKRVLCAAADTFRAAATEQLEKWAEKVPCDLVKGRLGSDPAAVAFDAISAAKSRDARIVLIDTAGRLHTKQDLMQELEKIRRVCGKAEGGAPHETLLVLDATIGQNGIEQAAAFHQTTPLTGLVLTKLDGTAKGGALIAIQKKLQLPITYVGTGETLDALSPFNPKEFVNLLFE